MAIRISHTVHKHDLELKNYQKPYTCDGCKEMGFGLTYRCEQCDFVLHKGCTFIDHTISHYFLKKATFVFLCQKPNGSTRYCDGCGKGIHGFHYHCEEKGWDLHPCCAKLKLEWELPINGIKFQLRNKVPSKCTWCGDKKLKGTISGTRGWSYKSKCKKYRLHVYCVTDMVHQAWKDNNGLVGGGNNGLPNLGSLLIQANHRNRNGSGGKKILKILGGLFNPITLIHTAVSIASGDLVTPFGNIYSAFSN